MPGRKGISTSVPAAHERRERYYELRDQGLNEYEAAMEIDADLSYDTRRRYERWYRALRAGTEPPAPAEPSTAMRGNMDRQRIARKLGIPSAWN